LISDVSVEIATSDALPIERIGAMVSVLTKKIARGRARSRQIESGMRPARTRRCLPALVMQQEQIP